jgi:large subunit ribosomal protein L30
MYAVVRLRGSVNVRPDARDTLKMLRLQRVNHCVLLPESKTYDGMIHAAKDYIAWGKVGKEWVEELLRKRGRTGGGGRLTDEWLKNNTKFASISELAGAIYEGKIEMKNVPKMKPLFRLHPARGGLGTRGTKKTFKEGGAMGNWGDKIGELLDQMR